MALPTSTNDVTARRLGSVISNLWTKIKSVFAKKENGIYWVNGTTSYPAWAANTAYAVGDNVYTTGDGNCWTCKTAHTSGSSWSSTNWNRISQVTITGTNADIESLYSGLTIAYKVNVCGGEGSTLLNLNSLGAKRIYKGTGEFYRWTAGKNAVVLLTYDGTYWRMSDYDSNDQYVVPDAYCSTAAGTAAKAATSMSFNYSRHNNIGFRIYFTNTNTSQGQLTLNVNSQGAKNLWINGANSSSSNYTINAGIYWCYYDGTQFQLWTDKSFQAAKYRGDGSNLTEAFTAASSRSNIATGESNATIFGKIAKWFSDLGTAAFKNVPSSGNAGTSEVVLGSDTRLSDARTPTSHTHGNITNGGALQTTDITIASGDKLVVTDSSDSNKVARASISFDGSTTTQALTKAGTWATFNNYSHPAGSAASKTGVPTADATPGFGGTFKVNQITTDSTSHVSAVTERTITIPGTTATTSTKGLMSAADKTKLDTKVVTIADSLIERWGVSGNGWYKIAEASTTSGGDNIEGTWDAYLSSTEWITKGELHVSIRLTSQGAAVSFKMAKLYSDDYPGNTYPLKVVTRGLVGNVTVEIWMCLDNIYAGFALVERNGSQYFGSSKKGKWTYTSYSNVAGTTAPTDDATNNVVVHSVDIIQRGNTSHTHTVKINGSEKTIAATGGTAVDLGSYLPLAGGTMTGKINAWSSQYTDDGTTCAIDMKNSNIVGLNSLYTADASDGASEGIHFFRESGKYDTLWMAGGHMYFVPNRAVGTSTSAADSKKVAILPASITSGHVVVTDGTSGDVKGVAASTLTVGAATKATQDSDGNAINATYFKSSGNVTLVSGSATKIGTQNGTDVKLTLPTIPAAANNGALQLQLNGGTATSKFTANQSGNSTLAFSTGSTAGTFKVDSTEIAIAGFTKVEASSTNGNIKINGTETTVYTHPTTAGNKHIPSGGSSGQFLGYDSAGTAKWVSNPNTDTKQNITLATTTKAFITGVSTTPTATAQALTGLADTGVYLTTTAGELNATQYKVNEHCTMQYNSTKSSLDFVFS